MDALTELEANLDAHLRYVHESAGAPSTWAEARRYYGLAPGEPFATTAPVSAFAETLRALVLRAAPELERVQAVAGDDPVLKERLERVWDRLAGLVSKEAEAYEARTKPRGLGLGAIFENAEASVGKQWWSDMKYDLRVTLLCKTCGAPQQRTRDFKCAYCRGDLFRRGSGLDG